MNDKKKKNTIGAGRMVSGATKLDRLYRELVLTFISFNTISSHTDHFEIQKRDSEESILTFVNLFQNFNECMT